MAVLEKKRVKIDIDNPSIQRIESRCINCGMCMNTCENIVGLDHRYEKKNNALCINCGQCVMNCPVGALCTKFDYKKILYILNDTNQLVAISIAPAVRVSLGVEFGLEDGNNVEDILPSILRKIGFDYVFDVTFGADVTIMEEVTELLERLNRKENLPMFTSCCPAWVKYACMFHKELIPKLSTTKSPIEIQSKLIKTYFKEMNNIEENIISVVVAPCTAKKYEALDSDTDYVITTQELAMMMRELNIDIGDVKPSSFDDLLKEGSHSGLMFGRSGGVMESALNCAYYLINKNDPPKKMFHIDMKDGIIKKTYPLGDKNIRIAVIYGMNNLEEILDELEEYDFIEVMNCPMGCIGGGGQPLIQIKNLSEFTKKRAEGLNALSKRVDYCYQNSEINDLYRTYFDKPLSEKSKIYLHKEHKDLSHLRLSNKIKSK